MGRDGVEGFAVLVGNSHRIVRGNESADGTRQNSHDWKFFVKFEAGKEEFVRSVKVNLHPTFHPPSLTLTSPPFEVSRLGWGTFPVSATITLKDRYRWIVDGTGTQSTSLTIEWALSFQGRGEQGVVQAMIKDVGENGGEGFAGMDLDSEDDEEEGMDYVDEGDGSSDRDDNEDDDDDDYEDGESEDIRTSPVRWPHMERGDA